MSRTTKVAPYKKKVVDEFAALLIKYPIIGALNMENMPSPQLTVMRRQLRGKVEMKMTKRRLLKLAIEKAKVSKPELVKLEPYLKGMPAILFTNENPFSLYKTIKKSKSKAFAKPGQIAPYDLIVKAGPTSFTPGPVIGELGQLGIKAGVEAGKIAIKEDAVIVAEGKVISDKAASMLMRLGIEPMEVGLDLVAVYEDGIMYGRDVLDIDEKVFGLKLSTACIQAINLGVEARIPNKITTPIMIQKAFRQAKGLALEAAFPASGVTEELIQKGVRQAKALKSEANLS